MENVKDSYHASILHLFFTTFELNRLSQTGGIIVDPSGGHHVSFSAVDTTAAKNNEYAAQDLRSDSEFKLADPSLLQSFKEFPDTTTLQILSVFPTFVLQQIQNAIAVRQIVPRGYGPHGPALDPTRLRRGHTRTSDDAAETGEPGRARRIHLDGGRLRRRFRAARHRRRVRRGSRDRNGRSRRESSESRVTEASVRGFWKAYRTRMGI